MTSLANFEHQLEGWMGHLDFLRKQLTNYQETYKQTLGTLIQNYESQIQTVIPTLVDLPDDSDDVANRKLLEHTAAERTKLEKRRQELRDVLIPQEQKNADECVAESQQKKEEQHQENMALYEKQSALQEKQATLEQQLQELNDEISVRAKGLGVLAHFFAIYKLRKRRAGIYKELGETLHSLNRMRQTWETTTKKTAQKEAALQARWEGVNLCRGRYQSELDILDNPEQFERLAQTQAGRTWLDALRTPLAMPLADQGAQTTDTQAAPQDLRGPINALVELNLQSDAYRDALGAAAQLNAVCQAVANGLKQMDGTLRKLMRQENQYSQYLPRLSIEIPPNVEMFNSQWRTLTEQIKDQEHLTQNPQEFTQIAKAALEDGVSNEQIKDMFENIGLAINVATKRWGKR